MEALNYTVKGQGMPIVFIHGFCESLQIWESFSPTFESNFQVIYIDLPGHGKSKGLGYETSVDKMAFQVKETLNSLNIKKALLVGHSLGGYVTIAFADMFPEMLLGICFFHSSAFEDTPEKKENRNKTMDYVEKHGVDAFSIPFVPGLFFHKHREQLKEHIDFATQIARKMNKEDIINTIRAMRDRKDRAHVLEEIQVPVAFIVGKEDSAVPLNKSLEQCALAPKSQVLFLGETSHMGMFERKTDCQTFLKGFLDAIDWI